MPGGYRPGHPANLYRQYRGPSTPTDSHGTGVPGEGVRLVCRAACCIAVCERWWRGGWRRGGTGRSILGLLAGILTVVTVRPVQDCRHCGDTCCCWPALQTAALQSHQQGRVSSAPVLSSLTHLVGASGEDKLGRPPLHAPHQLQSLALYPQPELKITTQHRWSTKNTLRKLQKVK